MLGSNFKGLFVLLGILSIVLYCTKERGSFEELQDFSTHRLTDAPEWVKRGVIYEIFPRVFSEEGSFKGIEKKLDHIQQLGANIIWLMPIFPIGTQDRKGSLGSPYAVRDLMAINPDYGTGEDLHSLVRAVHQRNMKIILDIVPNHGADDYVLMKDFPEGFLTDENSTDVRKEPDWSDVTDFNFDELRIRQHLKNVFLYWIEEFDIDGYRCDVAGLVPYDFWHELIGELKRLKPDIYLLAEWEDPEILLTGFHSDYGWTEYHDLLDIRLKNQRTARVLETVQVKSDFYPQNHITMRFLENHDEKRSLKTFGIQAIEAYTTLLFTLPGIPLIYAGQEIGELETPSLFEKTTLEWENGDLQLLEMYKRNIQMRKNYACLADGYYFQLQVASFKGSVGAFLRWNKTEAAIVITNLWSSTAENVLITIPERFRLDFESYEWKIYPNTYQAINLTNIYFDEILPYQTLVFLGIKTK
jgi:glycosidase